MNLNTVRVLFGLVFLLFVAVDPAFAGPGGFIAKAATESIWGKIIVGIVTIVFLPLILWVTFREYFAARRVRKDLAFMAVRDTRFDWLKIQQRAKECFIRVHAGWEKEDLAEVNKWMTDWYWQNQQLVHLDRWEREGLRNVCKIRKIRSVRPLMFVHHNNEADHEESMIVVSVTAKIQDYLEDRSTGKLVEGGKNFQDVETVWTLTMNEGEWKVSDIDEGENTLEYALQMKHVPPIETTVVQEFTA